MDNAIIVPSYKEKENILGVLDDILKYVSKQEIIVVDDGSDDGTYELLRSKQFNVLRHPINTGKGAALKTGCDYALNQGAKKIICIDSDGQHEPKYIPGLLSKLDTCSIVYTHRKKSKDMPAVLRFGNSVINMIGTICYGYKVKDPLCGFRGFRSEYYDQIRWDTSGYSVEVEMIFNAYGLSYDEIEIDTIYKNKYKGTDIMDGINIVLSLIWYKLSKRRNV